YYVILFHLTFCRLRCSTLFPYTTLFRSFYLLVRAYELGDGRYPHPLFHAGLAIVGVSGAFAAAARAQAADTRRGFLGEVIPFFGDRKSTRLNSSHVAISYAVFCLKKKTE